MSYMIAITVFLLEMATVMALYFGFTVQQPQPSWMRARVPVDGSAASPAHRFNGAASGDSCSDGGSHEPPTPIRMRPRSDKPISH